jgi:hypothetical protein
MSDTVHDMRMVWDVLREYIPTKERQAAADHLVSDLADSLSELELREMGDGDVYLRTAVDDHLGEDDDVFVDDEDEDED